MAGFLPLHLSAEDEVSVVTGGKAVAAVVLADQPTPMAQYAAEELITHVRKATGITLPLFSESQSAGYSGPKVYVGITNASFQLGVNPRTMDPDASMLRTKDDNLYIFGNEAPDADPLDESTHSLSGTLFGVYELLERYLHVRWLWPGELGTWVPATDNLVIDSLNEIIVPKLKFREFRYWDVTQAMNNYTAETKSLAFSEEGLRSYARDLNIFSRRHRLSHTRKPEVGHYFGGWWEEHGAENPDWFAMRADGGRGPAPGERTDRVCMCVSNPELHRYIVEEAWDGGDLLRLGEADNNAYCQCPTCMSWDAPQEETGRNRIVTDRYARFWKTIYELAVQRNPNVRISTFLYVNYFPAPLTDIQLNENIYGEFVPWPPFPTYYPMTESDAKWQEEQWLKWRETGITLAYRPNHPKTGYAMPQVNTWQGGEFIRFAYDRGMEGIDYDALSGQWAVKGPEHYMYYRLLVHPDQPIGEIRAEYFSAFGPAAGLVEQYFDYWELYNQQLYAEGRWSDIRFNPAKAPDQYPPQVFPPAEKILREALQVVKGDSVPQFAERVNFLMAGLEHAKLSSQYIDSFDENSAGSEPMLHELTRFRRDHEAMYISNYVYLALRCEERYYGEQIGLPYNSATYTGLAAVTWPDIPKSFGDRYGWKGDTIPGFKPELFDYKIYVPSGQPVIPSLVASPVHLNSSVVTVKRAASISGTKEERTVTFSVYSEDNSTHSEYHIELLEAPDSAFIQPYFGEPFFSEYYYFGQNSNCYLEICNPGNQPLDLSNYLIVITNSASESNPVAALNKGKSPTRADWLRRFEKYVPGFTWGDEASWLKKPGVLKADSRVNAIVAPGDVFVMTKIDLVKQLAGVLDQWTAPRETDVNFYDLRYGNFEVLSPWGVAEEMDPTAKRGNPVKGERSSHIYLYKILNDSVRQGLKPVGDPHDYALIDVWGNKSYSNWSVAGKTISGDAWGWIRKPEINRGNTTPGAAFGTNSLNSEWLIRGRVYYNEELGLSWTATYLNSCRDFGKHHFYEPTHYKSTVTSSSYEVSKGYSLAETICGIDEKTRVSEFLNNLIKADENQSLKVRSLVGGTLLGPDDRVQLNDTLVVVSADRSNKTKYILQVSDEGLSSNAILTSSRYQVTVAEDPRLDGGLPVAGAGWIGGFAFGVSLPEVLEQIVIPEGAIMSIIDAEGAPVPMQMQKSGSIYVDVTAHHGIRFDVVAQDNQTRIVYRLRPDGAMSDAFIYSDLYEVHQHEPVVSEVPAGTGIDLFLRNIFVPEGAQVRVADKNGQQKRSGFVNPGDKVIVTSSDGQAEKAYLISLMKKTPFLHTVFYLAYLLSDIYPIDQAINTIYLDSPEVSVDDLMAGLTPCAGASFTVINVMGKEKNDGVVEASDKVKVVSADGKLMVIYKLVFDLSRSQFVPLSSIRIWPNPVSSALVVEGVQPGHQIRVFNSMGRQVIYLSGSGKREDLLFSHLPSGLYVLVVSDNSQTVGKFKIVRR